MRGIVKYGVDIVSSIFQNKNIYRRICLQIIYIYIEIRIYKEKYKPLL